MFQVSCGAQWRNFPGHLSSVPRNVCFVGYVLPPVVAESRMLLACLWGGLTVSLADCKNRPRSHVV